MNILRIVFFSFIWLGIKAEEKCPSLYQRYSQIHTYCLPPNLECKIEERNVPYKDIEVILREHNRYRSRVATGQETKYSLPKASDMLEMVWDEELAAVSQKLADQCNFAHDCNECRRVKNFDVGQNLFERTIYPGPPTPNWTEATKAWYDEVEDFDKKQIDCFEDGEGPRPTGHFTQLVWATSWRMGCGYTVHKRGKEYVELYTCNYGPAGNVKNESMYKKGEPYSECPINSCWGKSCAKPSYPGLCQINGNNAPQYKSSGDSLFLCTFNNEPDCDRTVSGVDRWEISKTLSGSYIGIELNSGESSILNFTTPFQGKKAMCLTSHFRKGPQKAGQDGNNAAYEIVTVPEVNFSFNPEMQSYSIDFIKFSVTLNWNMKTKLSIKFVVPDGADPQYLEMKNIEVREGKCT